MTNRSHRSVRLLLALFGVFSVLSAASCVDPLADIDRRTRAVITARSASLGPDTLSPDRRSLGLDALRSPVMDEKTPGTDNPAATDLRFRTPEQERSDRVVAERLTVQAARALGSYDGVNPADVPDAIEVSLEDAFRFAQATGPEYLFAEENYILAAIAVLTQRHLFSPRFFNDTSVELAGFGEQGNFEHANTIINTLRVTQRLPSGGSLEASWVVQATDQLRDRVSGGYQQSSTIALSGNVPLLRGAGPVAREDLIQAERNLVYAARQFERDRRELLVSIAQDYFGLLQQQSGIENLKRQLEGLRKLEAQTRARVEAGRQRPFQAQLSANQVLGAEANLATARESFIVALDRFKVRLGIPVSQPLGVLPLTLDLTEPGVGVEEAAVLALHYRLDLQNERDRLDDNRRAVRNARNNLLPNLDLAGRVELPTEPDDPTGGASVDADEFEYTMSATFGLPLDRRIEQLALRSSIVNLERAARQFDDFRDDIIIEARQSVRTLDLSRFQLELAEQQVRINELRLEDLRLRDDTDPQSVVDAENDLISARNDRDEARANLRSAVLNHLLVTGQLRVAKDGTLLPLPGMPAADPPAPNSP